MQLEVPSIIGATSNNIFQLIQGGEIINVPFPDGVYEWVEDSSADDARDTHIIGVGVRKVGKRRYGRIPIERVGSGKGERVKLDIITLTVLDNPEFFRKLSNRKLPYPIFLDIETASSDGKKSNPEVDEIISVQLKYRGADPIILETSSQYSEKQLLYDMLELIRQDPKTGLYPDFIVGFYLNRFDIPYIIERLKRNGLYQYSATIGRQTLVEPKPERYYYPTVVDPIRSIGERYSVLTIGIAGVDLSLQTRKDVSLSHLPRKGLKQVVAFYGYTPYDIPDWAKQDMDGFRKKYPDKFAKYILSDIESTEYLYNVYEPAFIASSNILSIPLVLVQRSSHGFRSTVALYRAARENGFIGLYTNYERYGHLYERAPKYQGALVGCTKKGHFANTIYVDCKSMYPNIMYDFNISPDRYTFVGFEDYTGDEDERFSPAGFSMKEIIVTDMEDGKKEIRVPDDNYGGYCIFHCDFENDGYIRHLISKLNAQRDEFKRTAKEWYTKYINSGNTDANAYSSYLVYNSYQNEAKIINNTIYGVQGDRNNKTGDLPAAIFVTAVGRWIMSSMVEYFGDAVLEIDTDGLLLDKTKVTVTIDEVNEYLWSQITEKFGIPRSKMRFTLEFEGEGSVYLYKAKNYILLKNEDNMLTVKGSSFKGYDKAKVILDAVQTMSNAIMYKTMSYEEAVRKVTDIRGRPLDDFKFTKSVRKLPQEYKEFDTSLMIFHGLKREGRTKAEVVKELKERLLAWADHSIPSEKRKVEVRKSIRAAKTEDELLSIVHYFSTSKKMKNIQKMPIMLQISLDMLSRGRTVEIDDAFEFYWTLTPNRYTLIEDMRDDIQIDYERYLKEINRVIERFQYADPAYADSLLFDVQSEPLFYIETETDEEYEENSSDEN